MQVQANGGYIHYEVVGEGPPLLMPSHASTTRWRAVAAEFAGEYTVIGVDFRDAAGLTRFPPEPFTIEDLAADCLAVLRALGHERAHFVGLSHSALVGQALAIEHPEGVDRLALTMTTPGHDAHRPDDPQLRAIEDQKLTVEDEVGEALRRAQAGDPEGVRRAAEFLYSQAAVARDPKLVDAGVEQVFGPNFAQPPEVRGRFWAVIGRFTSRGRLDRIRSRTLVVTGSGDRLVRLDDAWTLWRQIPQATLVALDGVGHDWWIEAPARVAAVVKQFLRGSFDADA